VGRDRDAPVRFIDAPVRPSFGHESRWLINKSSDGWLLHEPIIGQDTPAAVLCRSFRIACQAFAHFHAADLRRSRE